MQPPSSRTETGRRISAIPVSGFNECGVRDFIQDDSSKGCSTAPEHTEGSIADGSISAYHGRGQYQLAGSKTENILPSVVYSVDYDRLKMIPDRYASS